MVINDVIPSKEQLARRGGRNPAMNGKVTMARCLPPRRASCSFARDDGHRFAIVKQR
jgi:hypothetical protein